MKSRSEKIWWVYDQSVADGVYVTGDDELSARINAATLYTRLKVPVGDLTGRLTARYVVTSGNPTKTIAGLWSRHAKGAA